MVMFLCGERKRRCSESLMERTMPTTIRCHMFDRLFLARCWEEGILLQ